MAHAHFSQVGEKLAIKVDEFLETGRVKEAGASLLPLLSSSSSSSRTSAGSRSSNADDLQHNERYQAIKSLMTVHGIGHHGARDLYTQGYRSAEDMRKSGRWEKEFRYHDDIQHPCVPSLRLARGSRARAPSLTPARSSDRIPRAEVESIARFVQLQVDRIERGSHMVICGGCVERSSFSLEARSGLEA